MSRPAPLRPAAPHMRELARLLALIPGEWPRDSFVLCGSAPLAVRGIRDVHDLDVMVPPERMFAVRDLGPERPDDHERSGYDGPEHLIRLAAGIDVWDQHPRIEGLGLFTFAETLRCADLFEVDGRAVNVLSLRHTLAIKALAMKVTRAKDLPDMCWLADLIEVEEEPGYRWGPPAWALGAPPPPPCPVLPSPEGSISGPTGSMDWSGW